MTRRNCIFCKKANLHPDEVTDICDSCVGRFPALKDKSLSLAESYSILGLRSENLTNHIVMKAFMITTEMLRQKETLQGKPDKMRRELIRLARDTLIAGLSKERAKKLRPGGSNELPGPDGFSKVPRKPLPSSGTGAIALPLPKPKDQTAT